MKRNFKGEQQKELRRLFTRRDEIKAEIRKLPYIQLDEPYQKGWLSYVTLREDIKNSSKGELLMKLIKKSFVATRHIKHVKHVREIRKKKWGVMPFEKYPHPIQGHFPSRIKFSKWDVDNMTPETKKYYLKQPKRLHGYKEDRYYINLPKYYYVLKTKPRMVTEVQEVDTELQSEYDLITNKLFNSDGFKQFYGGRWHQYAFYKNHQAKSDMLKEFQDDLLDFSTKHQV